MKAYKLFRIKNERLYPLYVLSNKETKINEWLDAECGEISDNGKVKSKLGELAYRPGWHLTEFPLANHIGKRNESGKLVQARDTVWCEVEFTDEIDYTNDVKVYKKNGDVNNPKSYMKDIPKNGYYWYQTNPNAECRWLIAGSIKITKVLTHDEVVKICNENGIKAQEIDVA